MKTNEPAKKTKANPIKTIPLSLKNVNSPIILLASRTSSGKGVSAKLFDNFKYTLFTMKGISSIIKIIN